MDGECFLRNSQQGGLTGTPLPVPCPRSPDRAWGAPEGGGVKCHPLTSMGKWLQASKLETFWDSRTGNVEPPAFILAVGRPGPRALPN